MPAKRGPSYPAMSLPEAIIRARALYDQDGTARTEQEAAVRAWGYGSLNGTSLRVIAALKHYGLLESSDSTVRLTDRAAVILLEEEGASEWLAAIDAASKEPAMFQTIMSEFGGNLPSDGAIVSFLVRKQGFIESSAQNLVDSLRQTIEFVKQNNAVGANASVAAPSSYPRGVRERPPGDGEIIRQKSATPGDDMGEHMEFTWPLSGNAVATLFVSRQLDPEDVELLADYFAVAKKALVKAARVQQGPVTSAPLPVTGAPVDMAADAEGV